MFGHRRTLFLLIREATFLNSWNLVNYITTFYIDAARFDQVQYNAEKQLLQIKYLNKTIQMTVLINCYLHASLACLITILVNFILFVQSEFLREAFDELDMTSEVLQILMSPDNPYFRLSTFGYAGITHVRFYLLSIWSFLSWSQSESQCISKKIILHQGRRGGVLTGTSEHFLWGGYNVQILFFSKKNKKPMHY